MVEDTIKWGWFADAKVHNSEYSIVSKVAVVRFHEAPNFIFLSNGINKLR